MATGQVVNSVVTEVTAETEGLRTKLQVAEGYIDRLKQQTATAGTAATQTGQKFSGAALNIASATESMARMGRVTGESAKQVIAQASNIAFAFGSTGAIVGAVGIATLAIIQLFRRTNEEAQRTKKNLEELRAAREQRTAREDPVGTAEERAKDARARLREVSAELDRLARGSQSRHREDLRAKPLERAKEAALDLTEAMKQLAEAEQAVGESASTAADKEAQALGTLLSSGQATNAERTRAAQLVAQLTARLGELAATGQTDAATLAERVRLQGRLEALTKSEVKSVKDADAERKKAFELITKQAAEAERALDAQVAARRKANATILDLGEKSAQKLAELAGNATEALRLQVAAATADIEQLGEEAGLSADEIATAVAKVTAPMQASLRATEALRGALAKIEIPASVQAKLVTPLQRVGQELDALRTKLEKAGIFSEAEIERALDAARVEKLTAAFREMGLAEADAKQRAEELAGAVRDVGDATADLVRNIATMAQALLSVAGALGDISTETQAIARGAINIGAGIATAFTNPVAGGVQILGGIGDIISGLSGAEERRQQRQDHKENLDALRAIEQHTGDLVGIQISGSQFAGIRGGVEQFIAATGSAGGHREFRNIDVFFEQLGLDWEDVNALAQSMGITLNSTKQSYLDFLEALKSADLFAFTNTFSGQLSRFQLEMQLFGDQFDEPIEKFAGFVDLLSDPNVGAPALFGALDGLDASTAEGREAIRAHINELFKKAAEGTLTPEELGGLSLQEFLDALGFLDQQLDAADAAVRSFADTLSEAFGDIDLEQAIFGGTDAATVQRKLEALGLGAFDLDTAAGRTAALEALRELARTTTDRDLKQLIASVVRSLESLPELPTEIAEAVAEDAARGTGRAGGAIQTLTIFQGDRLITLAESQLLVTRLGFDRIVSALTGSRTSATGATGVSAFGSAVASALKPRPPIQAPVIPGFGAGLLSGAGAVTAGGGVLQVTNHWTINVAVPEGTTDPHTFAGVIRRDLTEGFDKFLGDHVQVRRFLSGNGKVF